VAEPAQNSAPSATRGSAPVASDTLEWGSTPSARPKTKLRMGAKKGASKKLGGKKLAGTKKVAAADVDWDNTAAKLPAEEPAVPAIAAGDEANALE
jgi:hypothetical protein